MEKKQYKKAMEIADTIDWRRVKNVSTLNTVSEILCHTSPNETIHFRTNKAAISLQQP